MQEPIIQIWMSPSTQQKRPYGLFLLGGILAIVLFTLLLTCGGIILGLHSGQSMELLSLFLCLCVPTLAIFFSVKLGRSSAGHATVFFLMGGDRLFAIDTRRLVYHGDTPLDYAISALELQKYLSKFADRPYLPARADEILKVKQLREKRTHYVVICLVRHPNRHIIHRTYFLMKDVEYHEQLLQQLERRKKTNASFESTDDRSILLPLICFIAGIIFSALCVLSHPAVAQLPQNIYFPCLGAAFATLCCGLFLALRRHLGP